MSARPFRVLRIFVMVLLALLFVQYDLGILVNIANPPSLPAFALTDNNAFTAALQAAGGVALAHATLGFLNWVFALVVLVLSLRTRLRSVQIFGVLTFVAVTVAGISGTLFVASGFNNDDASRAMAGTFILSYSLAFLELYFLRGVPAS